MSEDSAGDVRLVGCIVAMQNLLEVCGDCLRHNHHPTGPVAVALAGALNATESALRTLQREQPGLFRKGD